MLRPLEDVAPPHELTGELVSDCRVPATCRRATGRSYCLRALAPFDAFTQFSPSRRSVSALIVCTRSFAHPSARCSDPKPPTFGQFDPRSLVFDSFRHTPRTNSRSRTVGGMQTGLGRDRCPCNCSKPLRSATGRLRSQSARMELPACSSASEMNSLVPL